ncbi:uncharacterized protein METZ01_LOCUS105664 [marine metagenome]|uniref:Uncharacterized protein n=1 Tax=marine metagenome TaxID=408172 RepID=A0A381WJX5_9ZZZZ
MSEQRQRLGELWLGLEHLVQYLPRLCRVLRA